MDDDVGGELSLFLGTRQFVPQILPCAPCSSPMHMSHLALLRAERSFYNKKRSGIIKFYLLSVCCLLTHTLFSLSPFIAHAKSTNKLDIKINKTMFHHSNTFLYYRSIHAARIPMNNLHVDQSVCP